MPDKGIGHKIQWVDSLDSTSKELARRVDQELPPQPGEIIVAIEQRKGKGMGQNHWISEKGKNLTFSFLIHPFFIKAYQQFYLNICISLGVYNFIKETFPKNSVKIKWPNDIVVDGRKIAGILISHAVSGDEIVHSTVGIGLNVNQKSFPDWLPNPVSMSHLSGQEFQIPDVLSGLTGALNESWERIQHEDLSVLRIKYEKAMFRYKEWARFRYENEIIQARIMGISDLGLLHLEKTAGEVIESDLKEIEFLI